MKKEKKKFKDSALFGAIKTFAPEIIDKVTDVAASVYPPLSIVNTIVDAGLDKMKEKGNVEGITAIKEARSQYQEDYLEFYKLEVEDRKDARQNGNKHLQVVVAYFSLAGFAFFGAVQTWLSYRILNDGLQVNEFVIMTASNIFGLFTGLIFTLKDFLFGGSADPSKN